MRESDQHDMCGRFVHPDAVGNTDALCKEHPVLISQHAQAFSVGRAHLGIQFFQQLCTAAPSGLYPVPCLSGPQKNAIIYFIIISGIF